MNTKEYYRFGNNLDAQIKIDEEKAKNGDIDAMIRLARYFRTGETISIDDFEGVKVGLWYEYENDEGEKLVDIDHSGDYHADDKTFNKRGKYAKMAADLGDARGNYEYALFVIEKAFRENDYSEVLYWEEFLNYSNFQIPIRNPEEMGKYKDLIIEESNGIVYRHPTQEEIRNKVAEAEENIEKNEQPFLDAAKTAFDLWLKAAEDNYVKAQYELGLYYYCGRRFSCPIDERYLNGDYPSELFCYSPYDKELSRSEEDFSKAEEWFGRIINNEECDDMESISRAYLMLARIYANADNVNKDAIKALDYYLKAKSVYDVYISSDEIVQLYVQNLTEIELKQVFPLIEMDEDDFIEICRQIPTDILKKHLSSICENLSIEEDTEDILGRVGFRKIPFLSIENTKMIAGMLEGNALVNFLVGRLELYSYRLSTIDNYADANGINIEVEGAGSELLAAYHKVAVKMNAENSVFAYTKLLELIKGGCDYARYRLAEKLWRMQGLEDSIVYLDSLENAISGVEYRQIVKELLEALAKNGDSYAQCFWGKLLLSDIEAKELARCGSYEDVRIDKDSNEYKEAKYWLELAAANGNLDAVVELAYIDDAKLMEAYLILQRNSKVNPIINDRLGLEYLANEDYTTAVKYFQEGLFETRAPELFFDRLIMTYGLFDETLCKEFIWDLSDKIINGKIEGLGVDFVNEDLIPMLLEKAKEFYNPEYAIRILQSREFTTPEGNYLLGCIFSEGEHISKNYKTARKYFEKAAQEDIGEAWYKLAYLYYYGTAGILDLKMAKHCFEKAIFCGFNCEYAYEMVRVDLNEKDDNNPMKDYADIVIAETPRGKERNARFQNDMANEFGEYWGKLNEKTRDFIYSGIKTYVDNYEDDDPIFDFSAAINPMAKSLEALLGDIFYTKYKEWLLENGVDDIKTYFESIGVRMSSDKDPFELGIFRFIAYERNTVNTDYVATRKLIRENNLPAVIRKSGKIIYKLQLHEKFAEYVNEIFKEDAFSSDERMQEITAFIINLISQVEVIREDLRNRASHDTVMKAMHAEQCGNILYKTKKLLYNLISKIKD